MMNIQGPQDLMQLMQGAQATGILRTAIELGVFGEIAKGHKTAATVATAIRAKERATRILLDACGAFGLVEKKGSTYALTAVTEQFLVPGKPTYMGELSNLFCGDALSGRRRRRVPRTRGHDHEDPGRLTVGLRARRERQRQPHREVPERRRARASHRPLPDAQLPGVHPPVPRGRAQSSAAADSRRRHDGLARQRAVEVPVRCGGRLLVVRALVDRRGELHVLRRPQGAVQVQLAQPRRRRVGPVWRGNRLGVFYHVGWMVERYNIRNELGERFAQYPSHGIDAVGSVRKDKVLFGLNVSSDMQMNRPGRRLLLTAAPFATIQVGNHIDVNLSFSITKRTFPAPDPAAIDPSDYAQQSRLQYAEPLSMTGTVGLTFHWDPTNGVRNDRIDSI